MRFILSLIIITLLITYLIIPSIKYVREFGKKEASRIESVFNKSKNKRNGEKE